LLRTGGAAVFRHQPFTIILAQRKEEPAVQPIAFKVDPGSRTSGLVLVADFQRGPQVVFAAELAHRGQAIKGAMEGRRALRRGRRQRHTRYRPKRFDNRVRPEGWLPPSLRSRILNIVTWRRRLGRWAPLAHTTMELVRFDTQALQNPEISGVEYQQGTLLGFEVREYLLEKFHRTCVYCKKTGVPLEIDHIVPRSRGGVDSVRNLTLACQRCNQKKGNRTAAEFGHPEVEKLARLPLKDAAAINTTRWELWRQLTALHGPIETGSGGRTKFNRRQQGYPKAHWIDAACVGVSGQQVKLNPVLKPLLIKAVGRGKRQYCQTDRYGFPKGQPRQRIKRYFGFQTGDLVRAGSLCGHVTVRRTPKFDLCGRSAHPRNCRLLQRADGYRYGD
jgi:5-methylcytosine-specific restriction endonuclease McrA